MVGNFQPTVLVFLAILVVGKAEIYIVTIDGEPIVSYQGDLDGFEATAVESDEKIDSTSEIVTSYARHLENKHDMLLGMLFERGSFKKLYSYKHLINGFAVDISHEQAETLRHTPIVKSVERDWKVRKLTTHTPEFLGLPTGVWPTGGGFDRAGEDIVIGFVDSGIYPHHPSFATYNTEPFGPCSKYKGKCEVDSNTKKNFCNGKIVGAQHFAEAAKAAGAFNPSIHFASPLDGDGHGSHTAAIAAGNNGIPVRLHGYEFGKASGMAPRARIAVYKALYRIFGGFVADVVAAIDQAVHDGVDILSLSVGPNSPPATTKITYLNPFDATLLSAVKAGVFVAQAAGNGGPFPKTLVSYSPWIATVAAAIDDRRYKNHLTLGNGKILAGLGLSPATHLNRTYTLVAANDVLLDSSVRKSSPSDCQRPEVLNKRLVEGKVLLCGYSFSFVVGTASIKKVAQTAKALGAAGFVLAVENVSPGAKFDPVPVGIPGILLTDVTKSMDLIDYYNTSTPRDWTGRVKSFDAVGSIGDGLMPLLYKSAPEVALFSARGPNIRDFSFQDADLLKPDILAPGSLIWAAWSPNGTDEPNYVGEAFAMISGTSMAAPHIAGIAALVKQKHPNWSPAAIKSALMTTSTTMDRAGRPLKAQQFSETEVMKLVSATPFDYGSGHVNPRAALDPGLIFDAGYEDYLGFLCTTAGINVHEIHNYTNSPNEPTWKNDALALQGLGLVNPKNIFKFYNELHSYLASAGIDGVKVDVQCILETLGAGFGGRVELTRQYHQALDASVAKNFADNDIIACMSHNTDALYCAKQTAVVRASDDFYPRDPVSHTIHIAAVAYNSVFLGEIMQPDWDMFHSLHPAAEYHASARAISGGPVYVSDAPGKHNFELLKKLVLPDGSVLRARLPGRPTRDCLFSDPARDGVSLLKIWNLNKHTGVIGIYNCQGAAWNSQERRNTFHDTNSDAISGYVKGRDVHHISEAAADPGWNGDCAFYCYRSGDLINLPYNSALPVSLKVLEFDIFTITPIKLLAPGFSFAPIGLIDMFNAGGAIEGLKYEVKGGAEEVDGGIVHLEVKGRGRFGAYSSAKPRGCTVDSSVVEFGYDSESGLVTFGIDKMAEGELKVHDVKIEL